MDFIRLTPADINNIDIYDYCFKCREKNYGPFGIFLCDKCYLKNHVNITFMVRAALAEPKSAMVIKNEPVVNSLGLILCKYRVGKSIYSAAMKMYEKKLFKYSFNKLKLINFAGEINLPEEILFIIAGYMSTPAIINYRFGRIGHDSNNKLS